MRNSRSFLAGKQLSQESPFNYLKSLITQDGSCEEETRSSIARARNAFTKRKDLLTKALALPEEENYEDCHVDYSSVWSRIMELEERGHMRRLDGCEMCLWRKFLNITWSDKLSL